MSDPFNGFQQPGYTAIPNELLDTFLPILGEAELRVALFIARKTFGWHKRDDDLSLSQIAKGTGLSNPAIITATASLVERGLLVKRVRGKNIAHNYRLNVITSKDSLQDTTSKDALQPPSSNPTLQEVVNEVNSTSKATLQQLVKPVNTQKKVKKLIKENERKEEIAADAAPPAPTSKPVLKITKPASPEPPQAKQPTVHQALVGAIAKASFLDLGIARNKGRVVKAAGELGTAGATPEQVEQHYFGLQSWWFTQCDHWAARKRQRPTPEFICETWEWWNSTIPGAIVNGNGNRSRGTPGANGDPSIDYLAIALEQETRRTSSRTVEGRFVNG